MRLVRDDVTKPIVATAGRQVRGARWQLLADLRDLVHGPMT